MRPLQRVESNRGGGGGVRWRERRRSNVDRRIREKGEGKRGGKKVLAG